MLDFFIKLTDKIPAFVLVFMAAIAVIIGDYYAKYWSVERKEIFFWLGMAGYVFSGLFYIPSLIKEGLVITSLVWSIISLIGLLFVGFVIFKESLSTLQMIGAAFGIISVLIFALADK